MMFLITFTPLFMNSEYLNILNNLQFLCKWSYLVSSVKGNFILNSWYFGGELQRFILRRDPVSCQGGICLHTLQDLVNFIILTFSRNKNAIAPPANKAMNTRARTTPYWNQNQSQSLSRNVKFKCLFMHQETSFNQLDY